jgi:hypothetical protein
MAFERTGEFQGIARLLYDGDVVAEGTVPRYTRGSFNGTGTGLSCGYELGPAVGEGYVAPFPCTVELHRAVVEVAERAYQDLDAEFDRIMSEQ